MDRLAARAPAPPRGHGLALAGVATRVVPVALAGAAAAGYAAAAVFRHDHYGSNAYDLGIFDQTIWGYSRLELLPSTIMRLPNPMGFHFHPIIMSLAPLYWIWPDARLLLVAQAALIALAGLPLFLYARRRLGTGPALLFEAAYLGFWGVLGADLFDFHEVAFAAPIVATALYSLLTDRPRLFLAMVVLGLITREDLALTFAALGVFFAVTKRRRVLGLAVAAVSVAWFVVAVDVVVPALAGGDYPWQYSSLGSGPGDALAHVFRHPIDALQRFFTPRDKQIALFNLFTPWLALPLVSPLVLLAVPTLAARFFSDNPSLWAPQAFHYSLVIAPILAFAAVDASHRLSRATSNRLRPVVAPVLGVAVLLVGAYFTFGRLQPLAELRRYTSDAHAAEITSCLRTIPPDASVSATSALVPHLSQRRRIYQLDRRPIPQTRFYAIDVYTWTFPLTTSDIAGLVRDSFARGYGVRCVRSGSVVLERGARSRRLSPELNRLFRRA